MLSLLKSLHEKKKPKQNENRHKDKNDLLQNSIEAAKMKHFNIH